MLALEVEEAVVHINHPIRKGVDYEGDRDTLVVSIEESDEVGIDLGIVNTSINAGK